MFIMLGAGGIGFWCLVLPIALLFGPNIRLIPFWLRMPLLFILPVIGALIGDWLIGGGTTCPTCSIVVVLWLIIGIALLLIILDEVWKVLDSQESKT